MAQVTLNVAGPREDQAPLVEELGCMERASHDLRQEKKVAADQDPSCLGVVAGLVYLVVDEVSPGEPRDRYVGQLLVGSDQDEYREPGAMVSIREHALQCRSTYPAIIVFVKKANKLTSAKTKLVVHGRLEI